MPYARKDVDTRLESFKEKDCICKRNKELIEDFLNYLSADGNVGDRRQYKYITNFSTLFEKFVDMPLDEMRKDDMRRAVGKIESSDYSEWSKHDFKVALKKFYQTMWEDEVDRPKWVKKILKAQFMKTSRNVERSTEQDVIEPEEVMNMVDAADTARDKLIPLFFFETGARINEIRECKVGDVELNQKYADVELITLKNDKGPRVLTLTKCVGLLQRWLDAHPRGDDPDAPLFCNTTGTDWENRGQSNGNGVKGEVMTARRIAKILENLADEAGVDKRVNPHTWRHSAATYYGMKWSSTRMMYWFGWKDSSMTEIYCDENEDRMRKERLAEAGIDVEENGHDATAQRECGRCGEKWPPTTRYCGHCSLALDMDAAQDAKDLKESVEDVDALEKEELMQEIAALKEQVDALDA